MTPKSIQQVIEVRKSGNLYNVKYQVKWKASVLKSEHHELLFRYNPYFIIFCVPDIRTVRHETGYVDRLRIEWKKAGQRCWVDLKFMKAFNLDSTVDWFERQTYQLIDISKEEFDSITPLGEDD